MHSINPKATPQTETLEKTCLTSPNGSQKNGHFSPEKFIFTSPFKQKKSESTDTFELQTIAQQRPTIEAFAELEHLVPNGLPGRADIVEMSSLLYDDEDVMEFSLSRNSIISPRSNNP